MQLYSTYAEREVSPSHASTSKDCIHDTEVVHDTYLRCLLWLQKEDRPINSSVTIEEEYKKVVNDSFE